MLVKECNTLINDYNLCAGKILKSIETNKKLEAKLARRIEMRIQIEKEMKRMKHKGS